MNSNKDNKPGVSFYLGVAGKKAKEGIFGSRESETALKAEWESIQDVRSEKISLDKDALLYKIREQIATEADDSGKGKKLTFFRKYAAILIIGLVLGSGGFYFGIIRQFIQSPQMLELSGASDGKSEFLLPDGSRVSLNANTSLTYPESFSKEDRRVFLSGEAYFEVRRDEARPFLISTPVVDIEVLGTTFNVKAYPGAPFLETVLLSGKVRISRMNPVTGKSQSVILTPNHKAVFIAAEEKFILDKVDVYTAITWRSATLSFDNELLADAIRELEGRYDRKISLSEDLPENYRITMTIDQESLEEVLSIIEKTLPLAFKELGDEIVISAAH